MSTLERGGSIGNSAMRRPSRVSSPSSSRAPSANSCSMAATRHGVAQVGPLDLGHVTGEHLVLVCRLGIEAVALAGAGAAGAAGALTGRGLRDGDDDERVHADLGVVGLLLDEARVDDVVDAVDGERGLCDVGRDHHLARAGRRGVEDACLHLTGQCGDLAGGVDLLLSGEEEEHVARRLGEVDLHHGDERGVEVVGLRRLGVEDLDGEGAARDREDRALVEVGRVLLRVERRGGADDLEILAPLEQALEQAEEHVGVDGALVRLVEHDE
eukprot:scaffold60638_cov54-Phaeocystis_antarctica.AAC.3